MCSPPRVIPSGSSNGLPSTSRTPEPVVLPPPKPDGLGEATSTLVPEVNLTGADVVVTAAEDDTSARKDPGTERPEVIKEPLGQSLAQPESTLAPPQQAGATRVETPEVIPSP